jgi:hypothetical protein
VFDWLRNRLNRRLPAAVPEPAPDPVVPAEEQANGGLAGMTWWATTLADAEDVRAELAAHEEFSHWYAGENGLAGVVRLLMEKRRIAVAIAFAQARFEAGEAQAEQLVPRLDRTGDSVAVWAMLARDADAAVRELLPAGEERSTTLRISDADFAIYGEVRVRPLEPGRAEVSLTCWYTYSDLARYFGDNPPAEHETRLQPEGSAIPDLAATVGVTEQVAVALHALGTPWPDADGYHLTFTIPTGGIL